MNSSNRRKRQEKISRRQICLKHYRRPCKKMSGSSKQTTSNKGRQGKQMKRSWRVDWWRGKHSVRKIFTLGFWRSDKLLAFSRNKNITWHLFCRMKEGNLVVGENLSQYKINKLQQRTCFVQYLRTHCFCIRKLTRFLISQQLVRKYRTLALSMK